MTKHSKFIAIFVAALFAVFTAGNLLAAMPDREPPSETQAVVMDKSVASSTKARRHNWWQHHWSQHRQSPKLLEDGQNLDRGSLTCLRGLFPDEEKSELESAMDDFAFCLKCPQVCGAVRHNPMLNKPEYETPLWNPELGSPLRLLPTPHFIPKWRATPGRRSPLRFPTPPFILNPNERTNQ